MANKKVLIGHVGVDSGQLMVCDPCYIDSEWKKEEFEDIRVYEHKLTKKRLQYRVHFENYESLIPEHNNMTMNQLMKTGDWEEKNERVVRHQFSYNGVCNKTVQKPYAGEVGFANSVSSCAVAFSSGYGDGVYPVYATYNDDGRIIKVTIEMQ